MSARHRKGSRADGSAPSVVLFLAASLTGACGALAWLTAPTDPPVATNRDHVAVAAPAAIAPAGPARIEIARIDVNAGIEPLVRRSDGTIETPRQWANAGWYAEGVRPGDRGSAVIAGHVDSAHDGPAVFYRLDELQAGDDVTIVTGDGAVQRFVVVTSEQVAKAEFPTARVYAPSSQPLLRLVTCTGGFDSETGSYVDNLVVTARAV